MLESTILFWSTVIGTLCWPVCFWWMHRISARQNAMLEELKDQAKRVESLSREEHALIKEVHPGVGEIQSGVKELKSAVRRTPR